jgi:serine/threonine-protein kinase
MSERWGKYALTSLIARGGMAEVFGAQQLGPSGFVRPVCLKCVRTEYSCDSQFVSMFEAEARIAATLQHPNIVQVLDFDRYEGRLFLVMELVDGWDLRRILARARRLGLAVPLPVVVHIFEGLLLALEHAHGRMVDGMPRPVVHRDVSPHNVLVSVEGVVKLADFGIAKARGLSDATRTGLIKGKLAYLSPEQASGETATPASDLFSAGLVFYEMLSGRRALDGEDDRAIAAQLQHFSPAPIAALADGISSFLDRLLAPEPGQRFPSAEAALSSLRRLGIPGASMKEVGRLVASLRGLTLEQEPKGSIPGAVPSVEPVLELEDIPETHVSNTLRGQKGRCARWPLWVVAVVFSLFLFGGAGFLVGKVSGGLSHNESQALDVASPTTHERAPDEPLFEIRTLSSDTTDALSAQEAPSVPMASGSLSVFVRPWASVAIDGVPRGQTPMKNLRLSAGSHRVLLVNEELGYRRVLEVEIEPGEQEVISHAIPRR